MYRAAHVYALNHTNTNMTNSTTGDQIIPSLQCNRTPQHTRRTAQLMQQQQQQQQKAAKITNLTI